MTIQIKSEIMSALQDSNRHVQDWFSAIPVSEYFTRHGEVWSAADNVDHVIKAIKPIVQALKLPRLALHTMFGKPQHSSRSFEEICTIYSDEIAKGAKASGRFLPGDRLSKTKNKPRWSSYRKSQSSLKICSPHWKSGMKRLSINVNCRIRSSEI